MNTNLIGDLTQKNNERWKAMHIPAPVAVNADAVCKVLITGRTQFQELSTLTHVPWGIIAVIGYREYGLLHGQLRWDRSLAQGDPFNVPSVHEPKGRGPFKDWQEAGYDALVNCAPQAALWKDWSMGGALTILE